MEASGLKPKPTQPWHIARAWCVESARTGMRLDRVPGPKVPGNNWPDMQFERNTDYAPDAAPRYRIRPSPREISDMMAFLGLVNDPKVLSEDERQMACSYGVMRNRRHIASYLRETDQNHGEYNRALAVVFRKIFEVATHRQLLVEKTTVATSENSGSEQASSRERTLNFWRSDVQTSPAHLGTLEEQRKRTVAELKKRQQIRQREAASA